ncbi:ThuA domain-containing protein [Planotetraspora sp. A-T 1434]|uniref:ThuA domain-containing protein n=1 Tax=Planotetraspora sp. A-T 1434 TaxID=2979219 RepID=UPI0021C21687|nr:ThuA domain-containing protein [Planotetraspora sp. A-T 1434]MCT9935315.1 ThuA domain-containing protein [Planotetraspora sp. A-T 1434]
MGTLTKEQIAGLVSVVHAGTGFAGWHGRLGATLADLTDPVVRTLTERGLLWAAR